jgi:hypothetical protein
LHSFCRYATTSSLHFSFSVADVGTAAAAAAAVEMAVVRIDNDDAADVVNVNAAAAAAASDSSSAVYPRTLYTVALIGDAVAAAGGVIADCSAFCRPSVCSGGTCAVDCSAIVITANDDGDDNGDSGGGGGGRCGITSVPSLSASSTYVLLFRYINGGGGKGSWSDAVIAATGAF